jgi:heat shock protein HslJ
MKPLIKPAFLAALVLCGALLIALPSCSGRNAAKELESTKWILTAYAVDGSMQDALPTPMVDATFADGKVSGNGGINQYSGSYETDGSKLSIGPLMNTQMAGEPAVMEQEAAYLTALQAAGAYKVDGDTLTIKDKSADTLLEFRAAGE